MPVFSSNFLPTIPFRNGYFNTTYRPLFMKDKASYTRKRITTWDHDFIDLDFSLVGSDSKYIASNVNHLNNEGLDTVSFNLRGCSGEDNLLLSTYHSGKTEDVRFVVNYLLENYNYKNIIIIGFSLGGNLTLKYIGDCSFGAY